MERDSRTEARPALIRGWGGRNLPAFRLAVTVANENAGDADEPVPMPDETRRFVAELGESIRRDPLARRLVFPSRPPEVTPEGEGDFGGRGDGERGCPHDPAPACGATSPDVQHAHRGDAALGGTRSPSVSAAMPAGQVQPGATRGERENAAAPTHTAQGAAERRPVKPDTGSGGPDTNPRDVRRMSRAR